jgi:hypothetical protein
MNQPLKLFTLFGLLLCLQTTVQAQDFEKPYKGAAGIRFGYWSTINLSGKLFIRDNAAIEANIGTRSYLFSRFYDVTGLYQRYSAIKGVDGLNWYYGGGASLGIFTYTSLDAELQLGFAGVLGAEYKFEKVPIAISLDWMPTYYLLNSGFISAFAGNRGGLAVRYTFSKD